MATRSSARTDAVVRGTRISHPERIIYPQLGFSKLDLARYYERIGGWPSS